jgi:xanthine/uracil permease
MIGSLVRSVGAVLVGLAVAMVLIVAVEVGSSILHPFPPGVDPHDYEACKAHVARYPQWILALAALAWGLTTFVSAWLATRLGSGRHRAHGFVVGLILLALAVMNMSMLPYPLWFWAANLILFPPGFYYGAKLGGPRPATGRGTAADADAHAL